MSRTLTMMRTILGARRLAGAFAVAGAAALAAATLPAGAQAAGTAVQAASGAAPHAARKRAVPAANFFVEWRIRPAAESGAPGNGVVITSGSAATGGSGYGPGAVVVGTAQGGAPYGAQGPGVQGVRVANGQQATLRFDRVESTMVWDASWSARAQARGRAPAASAGGGAAFEARAQESGAAGHEVLVHHVQGLRLTPRWSRGDTLELDLEVTRLGDASDPRDLELQSTVRASLDEWLTVARLGQANDELQVRVTWQ
jgi:hypothetical protein